MTDTTVKAAVCTDTRCTDGITMCQGCNGHGLLSPRGGTYRTKRTDPIPTWAVEHAECNGTGLVDHTCATLDDASLAVLAGRLSGVTVQRWSTVKGKMITVGVLTPASPIKGKGKGKGKATTPVVGEREATRRKLLPEDRTLLLSMVQGEVQVSALVKGQHVRLATLKVLRHNTRVAGTVGVTDLGKAVRADILAQQSAAAAA